MTNDMLTLNNIKLTDQILIDIELYRFFNISLEINKSLCEKNITIYEYAEDVLAVNVGWMRDYKKRFSI
jgi:hypothetical protein